VIDRIVADGKPAIPVLISQITDARWIAEPVHDFWPRIRAGELAYFILNGLFVDDTWQKSTMPALFPPEDCSEPVWVCWGRFREKHRLSELQARWTEFWKANGERIYWDPQRALFQTERGKVIGSVSNAQRRKTGGTRLYQYHYERERLRDGRILVL